MGRPVLTDAQVEDFRRRAVDVSMRLFAEEGYEGFTLRALARELGCSHATPYRYFDGKSEIFAAVRAEGFRRFAAALRAGLEGHDAPLDRVRSMARAYFDFADQHTAAFTIIFQMGLPEAVSYAFVSEAARDGWSVLQSVIGQAVESGALTGDVNEVAHTMWSGVHGVATLHLANELRMGRSAEQMLHSMTEALIRAHRPAESGPQLENGSE